MQVFDVAVIGGGPSGASAAITLAKFGYGVLLVDRAVFPRDKLCGDFINPANWPILQELNVSQDVLAREHAEVRKFRLTAPNGTEAATALPMHGAQKFGLGFRRYYLDHVLMERAKRDGACVVVYVLIRGGCLPLRVQVEQVHEEVVGQRLGPAGEDAVFGLPGWRSGPACRRREPSSLER